MNKKVTAVEKESDALTNAQRDKSKGKIAMNKDNNVSEYKIGRTTYIVKLVFNPASMESLSDILKRIIIRECEDFLGESGQEPEKQAV